MSAPVLAAPGIEFTPRRLTPAGEHCFFGYYDIPFLCPEGRRQLVHKVGFMDRLPGPEDAAQIGWVDVDGETSFRPVTSTVAWNFQQGSFLRWWPGSEPLLCFNSRGEGGFETVLTDLDGHERRRLPLPTMEVDPAGRRAFGANFSRRYDFRSGYGYAGLPDPFADQPQPDGDGVWLMEPESDRLELLWSLAELGEKFPPPGGKDRKLLIDTLNCSPSGERLICFLRAFPSAEKATWDTAVLILDVSRRSVEMVRDYGVASHYHWFDDEVFVMVIKTGEGLITPALFDLRNDDRSGELLDPDFFRSDGHCSYSPDRRWLLYDSYPIEDRRELYVYDLEQRRGIPLGSVLSKRYDNTPVSIHGRCDLHPRWLPDSRGVTFDSVHEGFRGIYRVDLPADL